MPSSILLQNLHFPTVALFYGTLFPQSYRYYFFTVFCLKSQKKLYGQFVAERFNVALQMLGLLR